MQRPYRHFDLPTQHLTGDVHYVPPKARSEEEIERRHSLPRGSVLAEYQFRGALIASEVLHCVEDEPDITFATNVFATSALNSTWYGYARGGDVMRKQLELPTIALETDNTLLHTLSIFDNARLTLDEAVAATSALLRAFETGAGKRARHIHTAGKILGKASLALACVPGGENVRGFTPFMAQAWARQRGLHTLQQSRAMAAEIGTAPSLAQLADPNSDLSVYIRRSAPNGVEEAFEEASVAHAARR